MIKIIKVSGFENEVVEKLSLYIIRWWMVKERMCC